MSEKVTPPFGLPAHADFATVAAEMTEQLRVASDTAEDLASRIKELYKDDIVSVQAARADYDNARHAYDGISTKIRTLLTLGKNPPKTPIDMSGAQALLNEFQKAGDLLIAAKVNAGQHGHFKAAAASAAAGAPSLGDITKVFDSIFQAIEWFVGRKDKERQALADLLEQFEIRTWSEAGSLRATPDQKPGSGKADAPGGGKDSGAGKHGSVEVTASL